jgi:hypothetical protein
MSSSKRERGRVIFIMRRNEEWFPSSPIQSSDMSDTDSRTADGTAQQESEHRISFGFDFVQDGVWWVWMGAGMGMGKSLSAMAGMISTLGD